MVWTIVLHFLSNHDIVWLDVIVTNANIMKTLDRLKKFNTNFNYICGCGVHLIIDLDIETYAKFFHNDELKVLIFFQIHLSAKFWANKAPVDYV